MSVIFEKLINHVYQQLTKFPFHNLNLLVGTSTSSGGTCFDHALRLKRSLLAEGFPAKIHEAEVCLTGEKTHRLVRVELEENIIFMDTGTGWPTCYLMPIEAIERSHEVAGIKFKIVPQERQILIQRHNGSGWLNMNCISIEEQDESAILDRYDIRYKQNLPFSDELRLSWLDGLKFNRIVGNHHFIYEANKDLKHFEVNSIELIRLVEKTVFPELTLELEKYLEQYS